MTSEIHQHNHVHSHSRKRHPHRSVVFEDGQTTIDYVLVYHNDIGLTIEENSHLAEIRKSFIRVLKNDHKIQIKEKIVRTDEHEIGFYLLHLPWDVLIEEAERLKLRVPLKKLKEDLSDDFTHFFSTGGGLDMFRHFHHKMPPSTYHTLGFHHNGYRKNHIHKSHSDNQHQVYFRNSQRQFVMKEILESISYHFEPSESVLTRAGLFSWRKNSRNHPNQHSMRLAKLLNENILTAAFPLHEGNILYDVRAKHIYDDDHDHEGKHHVKHKVADRKLLYEHWASWWCVFKFQPINEIEEYFGPKIAFYFAWLGFYTTWLFPMAILGIFFFFFGPLDPSYEEGNNFICGDEADNITMCPLCDECSSWHLSDICFTAKLNKMFDNIFTAIFSSIINFWGIFCLEFWKRHSKQLEYLWGVLDYHQDEEKLSPYFCYHAIRQRHNPVTGLMEPHFPLPIKIFRRLIGFVNLFVFVSISLFFHLVIIFLRLNLYHFMFGFEELRPFAAFTSNVFCGLLNLVFIVLIDHFYAKVAKLLSRWEMYKTERKYEESLILKLFILVSVNYYSHALYIAFLKGRFKFTISDASYSETCSHTGCHIEVAFYLFVTFGGKQALKSAIDVAYPRFKRFSNIIRSGLPHAVHQWEKDYQLSDKNDLIEFYLYLILQFGFVILFVAAFPLGPLFAFVFNLISIRIHAQRFLCQSRRTPICRINGIGIWLKILTTLTNLSVLTNALIIAFSSDTLDKLIYLFEKKTIEGFTKKNLFYTTFSSPNSNNTCGYFESKYHGNINTDTYQHYHILAYKLLFVLVYQNIASWVQKYIEASIPDMPTQLNIKIQKERYMMSQKLKSTPNNPVLSV